jgi:hypothetical protein
MRAAIARVLIREMLLEKTDRSCGSIRLRWASEHMSLALVNFNLVGHAQTRRQFLEIASIPNRHTRVLTAAKSMWAEVASLNQHARGRLLLPARPPQGFWNRAQLAPSKYPKQPTFRRFKSDRPRNVIDRVARDACDQSFQNIRCSVRGGLAIISRSFISL